MNKLTFDYSKAKIFITKWDWVYGAFCKSSSAIWYTIKQEKEMIFRMVELPKNYDKKSLIELR